MVDPRKPPDAEKKVDSEREGKDKVGRDKDTTAEKRRKAAVEAQKKAKERWKAQLAAFKKGIEEMQNQPPGPEQKKKPKLENASSIPRKPETASSTPERKPSSPPPKPKPRPTSRPPRLRDIITNPQEIARRKKGEEKPWYSNILGKLKYYFKWIKKYFSQFFAMLSGKQAVSIAGEMVDADLKKSEVDLLGIGGLREKFEKAAQKKGMTVVYGKMDQKAFELFKRKYQAYPKGIDALVEEIIGKYARRYRRTEGKLQKTTLHTILTSGPPEETKGINVLGSRRILDFGGEKRYSVMVKGNTISVSKVDKNGKELQKGGLRFTGKLEKKKTTAGLFGGLFSSVTGAIVGATRIDIAFNSATVEDPGPGKDKTLSLSVRGSGSVAGFSIKNETQDLAIPPKMLQGVLDMISKKDQTSLASMKESFASMLRIKTPVGMLVIDVKTV